VLFRHIIFEPVAGALTENAAHQPVYLTSHVAGMVSMGWPGLNASPAIAGMEDVCLEYCTIRDWVYTNASGTNTGLPMPSNHAGAITGTGGMRNIVVRNCTMVCGEYTNGDGAFQNVIYFDGPRGCAIVDNVISGDWKSGFVLMLTNDDVSPTSETQYDGETGFSDVYETPQALYNFIVGNNAIAITIRGSRNLIAENAITYAGTVSSGGIITFGPQCWKGGSPPSTPVLEYHGVGNVIRDNTLTGTTISGTGTLVRHESPSTSCGNTIGASTISGNVVTGTVSAWYINAGGVLNDASTATNNTANGVPRDGV
jgi:hypothetical protein